MRAFFSRLPSGSAVDPALLARVVAACSSASLRRWLALASLSQGGGGVADAHQVLVDGVAHGTLLLGGGRHPADVIMDLLDLADHLIECLEGLLRAFNRTHRAGDPRAHQPLAAGDLGLQAADELPYLVGG